MNVDSEVRIDGRTAIVKADRREQRVPLPQTFFTVDGYAPFSAQMLLVRYWNAARRAAGDCRPCPDYR